MHRTRLGSWNSIGVVHLHTRLGIGGSLVFVAGYLSVRGFDDEGIARLMHFLLTGPSATVVRSSMMGRTSWRRYVDRPGGDIAIPGMSPGAPSLQG